MDYNKYANIFKLNIPVEFGADEYGDTTDDMCEIIHQLGLSNDDYALGASKFVIFFDGNEVIKIPFNGYFYEAENDETGEYYTDFRPFEIVKDYCAEEERIYNLAVEAGVEMFFARTHYIGSTVSNTPFYASERVICDYTPSPSQKSVDTLIYKYRNFQYAINRTWSAAAIEYYGEELFGKFVAFIEQNGISDLHDGNIGYRKDGAPVLLDYSGYED